MNSFIHCRTRNYIPYPSTIHHVFAQTLTACIYHLMFANIMPFVKWQACVHWHILRLACAGCAVAAVLADSVPAEQNRLITYATSSLKLNIHPIISSFRLLHWVNWPLCGWYLMCIFLLLLNTFCIVYCLKCVRNILWFVVLFHLQCSDLLSPIARSANQTHALRHHTQVCLTPFGTFMVGDFWQSAAKYRCNLDIFPHPCCRLD